MKECVTVVQYWEVNLSVTSIPSTLNTSVSHQGVQDHLVQDVTIMTFLHHLHVFLNEPCTFEKTYHRLVDDLMEDWFHDGVFSGEVVAACLCGQVFKVVTTDSVIIPLAFMPRVI